MENFIDESAKIYDSIYDKVKLYKNVCVKKSKLGNYVTIGDDSVIERSILEGNCAINRRTYINDSEIGYYTYTGINTIINFSKIGRFCSIGRNVDIGGINHNYLKVSTMTKERFMQLSGKDFNALMLEENEKCEIGNDVWIAAGVNILNKVKIGNGAIIGAGAVVTHNIPAYAIAVGVPAKVIRYRCEKKYIDILQKIGWWNWPIEIINNNIDIILEKDICEQTISECMRISEEIKKSYGNTRKD